MDNEENTTTPTPRPLGYWLRSVDRLIEREFEKTFADVGATRRDWRILNVLGGDVDAPSLIEHLERRGKKLRRLVARGWVTEAAGSWTLTDEGRAAKERLGAAVTGIRAKIAGSVPDADFTTTVRSLEAIARELGWDESAPAFGRGRRRGFGRSGFGRPGFGPGVGHDFDPAFGRGFGHGFAAPGHPQHCGHGRHRHGDRRVQRAYENGFDAGFTRGREEQKS